MKYKQLIKNGLCKIQPHGNFKTRNEAELRIFKSCAQSGEPATVKRSMLKD